MFNVDFFSDNLILSALMLRGCVIYIVCFSCFNISLLFVLLSLLFLNFKFSGPKKGYPLSYLRSHRLY